MQDSIAPSRRLALLIGIFAVALILEAIVPLRKATQAKAPRVALNLAVAAFAAMFMRFVFAPISLAAAELVSRNHWGLLPWVGAGGWEATALAIFLLDYTLYHWHYLNHKAPFLWRFHNVHHADLDMDVSTASRFHVGELALSTFFRCAQVLAFGIDPVNLILFETAVTACAQFHHANIRLPIGLERALSRLMVTPRMHGVHHSIVLEETDSNFSTIFNFWDRIHSTIRLNVPQDEITIGVAAFRDPKELSLAQTLFWLPLAVRPWRLPDGSVPVRKRTVGRLEALAA